MRAILIYAFGELFMIFIEGPIPWIMPESLMVH